MYSGLMMCPFTKILNTVSNVVVDEVTVRGHHRSTRKKWRGSSPSGFSNCCVLHRLQKRCSIPQSSVVVQCFSVWCQWFCVEKSKRHLCSYLSKTKEGCWRTIKTEKYSVINQSKVLTLLSLFHYANEMQNGCIATTSFNVSVVRLHFMLKRFHCHCRAPAHCRPGTGQGHR